MTDENLALPINWYPTAEQIARRHVRRNDPCPCRSGRKFKACCRRRQDRKLNVIAPAPTKLEIVG